MLGYRVLVGDLVTNTLYDELPVTRINFSHVLNGPGKCDISMSPNPQSDLLQKKLIASNIDPAKTVIYIEKDGVVLWAGVLWEVFVVYPANRLRIIGEGFWSYFRRRIIGETTTFTDRDQHYVAKTLIDNALAETGGDIAGISTASTNVTSGVNVSRTYYNYQRRFVGEAIEDLANREGGFDFDIESTWKNPYGTEFISNDFQCYYPRKGTRAETIFDLDANLLRIQWQQKGQKFVNKLYMIGGGSASDTVLTESTDVGSIFEGYPLLEHRLAKKEITNSSTLLEHANRELQLRNQVFQTLTVEVNPKGPETRVGAFTTGDVARVRASRGYLDLDKFYRIMSYDVYVNEGSNDERISVVLSSVEATL